MDFNMEWWSYPYVFFWGKDGTVTIAKFIPCFHHQHCLSHKLSHTHQRKYYNND